MSSVTLEYWKQLNAGYIERVETCDNRGLLTIFDNKTEILLGRFDNKNKDWLIEYAKKTYPDKSLKLFLTREIPEFEEVNI